MYLKQLSTSDSLNIKWKQNERHITKLHKKAPNNVHNRQLRHIVKLYKRQSISNNFEFFISRAMVTHQKDNISFQVTKTIDVNYKKFLFEEYTCAESQAHH